MATVAQIARAVGCEIDAMRSWIYRGYLPLYGENQSVDGATRHLSCEGALTIAIVAALVEAGFEALTIRDKAAELSRAFFAGASLVDLSHGPVQFIVDLSAINQRLVHGLMETVE